MHHINGGTILLFLSLAVILCLVPYLRKNWKALVHRNDSPMEKAKREWRKAKSNTKEKELREFDLDLLVIEEINKATNFCELYNAYETGLAYSSALGQQKHREVTPLVCAAYTKRKKCILEEMAKAKKERELERRNQTENRRAPRPTKIDRRGQKDPGTVCYLTSLQRKA